MPLKAHTRLAHVAVTVPTYPVEQIAVQVLSFASPLGQSKVPTGSLVDVVGSTVQLVAATYKTATFAGHSGRQKVSGSERSTVSVLQARLTTFAHALSATQVLASLQETAASISTGAMRRGLGFSVRNRNETRTLKWQ